MVGRPLYRVDLKGKASWAYKEQEGFLLLKGDPFSAGVGALLPTNDWVAEQDVQLLPPCGRSKILALAYNYKSLVGEQSATQEPLFFFKSITGLIGSREKVTLPTFVERVWVEVELALVIGKGGRNISPQKSADHILGYTIANDMTALNVHGRDHHLARSKGLDAFCPLGPALIAGLPPPSLHMQTTINGRITQDGHTNDRILNDVAAVALVSSFVTLEPGDVLLTGTCAGEDSTVLPGDEVKMSIEGIGVLETIFV